MNMDEVADFRRRLYDTGLIKSEDETKPSPMIPRNRRQKIGVLVADLYNWLATIRLPEPPEFDEVGGDEDAEEDPVDAIRRLTGMFDAVSRDHEIATRQRDFLMGQTDALIGRLAGAHVAAGLIDMRAAQGFTLKETLPINQVLSQIEAQP